jgi:hypothetical protein
VFIRISYGKKTEFIEKIYVPPGIESPKLPLNTEITESVTEIIDETEITLVYDCLYVSESHTTFHAYKLWQ